MEKHLPDFTGATSSLKLKLAPKTLESHNERYKFALGKCLYPLSLGCLIAQIYRKGLVNQNKREVEPYRNH